MMNIRVQSVHFHADSKLLQFIEEKLQKLSKFFDRDIQAEVILKLQGTGSAVQHKIAEIHIHVPGGWLVDKKTDLTFESAVISSTNNLKRQLVRFKEKKQNK